MLKVSHSGDINLSASGGSPGIRLAGGIQAGAGVSNAYGVGGQPQGSLAKSGSGFGAGASGATAGTTSQAGANGTNGAIVIWEYS